MAHAALAPARAVSDAAHFMFRNPWNPLSNTPARQEHLRGGGAVRADDPPLRQADFRPRRDQHQRCRLSGAGGRRLEQAVLQSSALRPPRLPGAAESAEALDRRADVRPLRDAAARNGRGVSAPLRRLHHGLDGRAPGSARGRNVRSRRLHRLSAAMLDHLGPGVHTLAVCQPAVPLLAAVAIMEANGDPTRRPA